MNWTEVTQHSDAQWHSVTFIMHGLINEITKSLRNAKNRYHSKIPWMTTKLKKGRMLNQLYIFSKTCPVQTFSTTTNGAVLNLKHGGRELETWRQAMEVGALAGVSDHSEIHGTLTSW